MGREDLSGKQGQAHEGKLGDRFQKLRKSISAFRKPEILLNEKLAVFNCDCLLAMRSCTENSVDLIFADPPYFLSDGGISCYSGRMVSVDKGNWDAKRGVREMHEWNRDWLAACQKCLKKDGTIWVSGTSHIIYSIGFAMQELGFKILNHITWVKPNPPPNLSCRYFTHASEEIIWAAKSTESRHLFNYAQMKAEKSTDRCSLIQ